MLYRSIATVFCLFGLVLTCPASPLSILQENCVSCHSPSKRKGGLAITSRQALIKGGDSGPAIEPGKAATSYLIETLFPDADSHMPPKGQLNPKEISALEDWVNQGAKWNAKEWATLTKPKKANLKLTTFPDSYQPVLAMALSPDGKRLAASRGKLIDVYQITPTEDKRKPIELLHKETLSIHQDLVQSLAYTPDSQTLISGSFQKLIIGTTEITKPFSGRLTAISVSPTNQSFLVADSLPAQASQIHIFSIDGKRQKTIEAAHDDAIYDIAHHPDGSTFVSVSADKLAIIRDSKTHNIITTLEGHTSYVLSAVFGPEGKRIATGGDDEVIKIWDTSSGNQISSFATRKSGPVGGVAWTIDPDFLEKRKQETDQEKAAAINTDRVVAINDLGQPGTFTELKPHEGSERSTGARERRHDGVNAPLTSMTYYCDQLILIAGSEDGRLFAWDKAGKRFAEIDQSTKLAETSP